MRPPLIIAETRHGYVCASAGVDASNAKGEGTLVLLPLDPDASAARIREAIRERAGRDVGVIVSDSFGRPFRQGTTEVALGVAGLTPMLDLRGVRDSVGYELHATQIAVADELAGAAELVMGKVNGIPAALIRGVDLRGPGHGRATSRSPRSGTSSARAASSASAASLCPTTGANLKPWPLHGEPTTIRPRRSSRNSSSSRIV